MNLNEKRFDINLEIKQEFKKCRKCNEVKLTTQFTEYKFICIECNNYTVGFKKYSSKYKTQKRIAETIQRLKSEKI